MNTDFPSNLEVILWIVGITFAIGLAGGLMGAWIGKLLVGLVVVFFVLVATLFLMLGMPGKFWPQYASPAAICLLGFLIGNRFIKPLFT